MKVQRIHSQDSRVPTAALDAAVARASEQFPEADRILPVWANGRCLAEVWQDGRAKVVAA